MRRGEVARRLFQLGGAHVIRRRVDEVARERHAFGDARDIVAVDAVGHHEFRAVRIRLAVARELVGAEREGEGREARVVRRIGEAVRTARQKPGKAAGQEAVLVGPVGALQAEQHAAERAILAR